MDIKWGPVGQQVYERTYSRTKQDGSKENWFETVERVVEGNLGLVPARYHLRREKEQLVELLTKFAALPAGRHLWVSGVKGRQFLFNCHTAGWNQNITDHFAFTFDELMKGGGIGANYSNKWIRKYRAVQQHLDLHIVCDPEHADIGRMNGELSKDYSHEWDGCIPIEDSREGWVEALRTLVAAAYSLGPRGIKTLVFDVSRIRAYGELIRGFGGTASGPHALAVMLHKIAALLNERVGNKLSSLDLMEIDHYIAQCVVAGNVRRSARMSIKYWKDEDILDFIRCKTDDARVAHFTTNISVEVDNAFFRAYKMGDKWAKRVYKECIDAMYESGEPGFWNSSLSQVGEAEEVYCTNPCGEISMEPWENCNLGHVNLDHYFDDPDGAKKAFKLMTRFLIRATFGDINSDLQKQVVKKNRRIGVGFFGYQGWVCKQGIKYSESHRHDGLRKQLREFYQVIRETARQYASQLRIPEPIKVSTLAPTGTIAKLPGKSEGMQALFALWFIRNIRYANGDPKLEELIAQGYHHEPCIYTPDTTVVSFWCKDALVAEIEELGLDVSLIEDQSQIELSDALAVQAMLQREFVDNSISYTINMEKPAKDDASANRKLKKKLYHEVLRHLPELKGTTVLVGTGDRKQTPYIRITQEEFESYSGPRQVSQGEQKCKGNVCPVK